MPLIHHLLTAEVVSEPLVRIKYMGVRGEHYGKATSEVNFTSRSLTLTTEIIMDEIVRLGYCLVHIPLTHLCLGEKSTSQPRMSGSAPPNHHWPVVPLENDMFDTLSRFGKQLTISVRTMGWAY